VDLSTSEAWQFGLNHRVARNAKAFSIELKTRTQKPSAGLSPPTVTAGNWRPDSCISSIEKNDVTE
jgi:hypothetical protein